ncbi:MAG: DUF4968 domain-containing protein [Clostridia bacterium]|nr:DUF4968 domain-containing protein [Clostridia bacterium]
MKNKSILIVSVVVIAFFMLGFFVGGVPSKNPVQAQTTNTASLSTPAGITIEGSKLTIKNKTNILELQACKDNILRVNYQPDGKTSQDTLVVAGVKWEDIHAKINQKTNPITIETDKMLVKIDAKTFDVSVYDKSGTLMVQYIYPTDNRTRDIVLKHDQTDSFFGIKGFGISENTSELLLRSKGGRVEAGTQGHTGAPLIWSTKGYGVLVDTDGGSFDETNGKLTYLKPSKDDSEFYIAVGQPKEIMQAVAAISGTSPMFPKWAMGFTNTEWGIDEAELMKIVDTYRAKKIPIDNYCLDFDWKNWGQDNYGEWTWNTTKFPDSQSGKLKEIMAAKGIKLTGIMKPRIHVDTVQGKYADQKGYWINPALKKSDYFSKKDINELNFDLPEVRLWYWEHMKEAFDKGIIGYWNDEADTVSKNFQFMNMERSLYEGQRAYSTQRVWSINRNFYLGSQRYAYGSWSGDINTGFISMKNQRVNLLASVNVGQVKWGMDTGGFHGTPDPENYARWVQFSAFTPVFRVHGAQNQQRQPWVYGPTAEKAASDAIRLRYSLIPYIYAYEREAYETGNGLVRPLVFDYPKDKNVENDVGAWMFGDYLLVAPVVDKAQVQKEIYLPQGEWIDYFKGTIYQGGQTIKYALNANTWQDIPLFIKKGAIIPTQEVLNYIGEKPITQVNLDVFPALNATAFNYYDDDGRTYDYEKGVYFKQSINAAGDGKKATVTFKAQQGTYAPELKYYIVKVHGLSGSASLKGVKLNQANSPDALSKLEGEGYAVGKDLYGDVTYVKVKAGQETILEVSK